MNFHDNSKNKNQKIDFSFVSASCALSIKTGSKLREGLHIVSWEIPQKTAPHFDDTGKFGTH